MLGQLSPFAFAGSPWGSTTGNFGGSSFNPLAMMGGGDGFNGSQDLIEELLSAILGQGSGSQCGNMGQQNGGFGSMQHHHHRHHDEGCQPGAFPGCGGQQPPWAQNGGCGCGSNNNAQRPGSLAGASVWGDPHTKGTNGQQVNFSSPNGLFVNSNGSMVLTQAPASNQAVSSVTAYAPGTRGINADTANTQVYEQQNGQIVDEGTAQSLGIGDNPYNQGINVASGQSLNIGGGVTVQNAGGGSVNFNQTA